MAGRCGAQGRFVQEAAINELVYVSIRKRVREGIGGENVEIEERLANEEDGRDSSSNN